MALASHVQEEQHVGRQQSVNLLDEDVGHARLELTLLFVRRFRTKTACLCICFLKLFFLLSGMRQSTFTCRARDATVRH